MKSYRFSNSVAPSLLTAVLMITLAAVVTISPSAIADDVKSDVANRRDDAVVRSFLDHLDEVDSDRGEQAKRAVNDNADSAVDALTEGLIALYPDYANAVEASDDDRLEDLSLIHISEPTRPY